MKIRENTPALLSDKIEIRVTQTSHIEWWGVVPQPCCSKHVIPEKNI